MTPTLVKTMDNVNTSPMWLVYKDESGALHYQPYEDVASAGTLIDADSGNDMELVGWTTIPPVPGQ